MKIHSSKKMPLIAAFISFVILILVTCYFWQRYSGSYDIECDSYVSYRVIPSYFAYDTAISVSLHNDNLGKFSVEGKLSKDSTSWLVNREVHFSYKKLPDNSVLISHFKTERYGRDDVPEGIFRDTFLASDNSVGRVVTISKMMNGDGYLIGTLRAPVFYCASKKT